MTGLEVEKKFGDYFIRKTIKPNGYIEIFDNYNSYRGEFPLGSEREVCDFLKRLKQNKSLHKRNWGEPEIHTSVYGLSNGKNYNGNWIKVHRIDYVCEMIMREIKPPHYTNSGLKRMSTNNLLDKYHQIKSLVGCTN
jgi:hypothetical protein